MAVHTVNTDLFKKMITNGAVNLKNHYVEIDRLNVFPVPDGDTGTNMQMTMMAGVKDLNACDGSSMSEIGRALSRGLLMGARGNSGVILSQFFRGIYVELQSNNTSKLSVQQFVDCLVSGSQVAYKAVMQPVEGTILTVVRVAAEKVAERKDEFKTFDDLLDAYLQEALKTLDKTPEMLPVLKEAGVVDSGGAGFVKVIEGIKAALEGKMFEQKTDFDSETVWAKVAHGEVVNLDFPYCTEFIIKLKKPDVFEEEILKTPLTSMGDSLVVVKDEDICKVHIHCKRIGKVLELAQKHGELLTIKIENMTVQTEEMKASVQQEQKINTAGQSDNLVLQVDRTNKPKSKYGLIAVCFGEGIQRTFSELGVDYVIDGGQTMNPATEAFVEAIEKVNAENVIIIPNNSNVILSAQQAAELSEGVEVKVLPAKTIAAGFSSLMAFDFDENLDHNYEAMLENISNVSSGEITYAVRNTEMNGITINEGEFIGIANNKIVVSTKERLEATKKLIQEIVTKDSEIVTIFIGKDVNEEEKVQALKFISENFDADVEVIDGNQDIYSYIIAVE